MVTHGPGWESSTTADWKSAGASYGALPIHEVAVAISAEYQIGTSMRIVIVVASLACVLSAKADYVIKQTIENGGKTRAFEIKIKDTKLRIDTANQNSAIFDSKTGEETVLFHQQKAFVKISGEQLKSRTEALRRTLKLSDENAADIELKPTGKKETIQGYEAEEYTTTVGGIPTSVFVAKSYPNYQKFLEALSAAHKASALQSSLSIPAEKYPGMPLRTEIELKGQKVTTTLDSAEETTVPDVEFTVPADYKEMSSPQLEEK
jgi:Domain of unknown function (DUF4412)